MRRLAGLAAIALAATACTGGGDGGPPKTVFGGDRPVTLQVPAAYTGEAPVPLLLVLHGYSVSGSIQVSYFGAQALVEEHGILLAAPDGTIDEQGNRFWNATNACCDFYGTNVDDVSYLRGLIADIRSEYNVDPDRIWLWGHSNGGFMSYRMACEAPEIAAIVSLAGATFKDAAQCDPQSDVSVLQIHGTLDDSVPYAGSTVLPSAAETVGDWATYDGCTGTLDATGTSYDLDSLVDGNETRVEAYSGCPAGVGVELWTLEGGSHIPNGANGWSTSARGIVFSWLEAHPKP